MGNEVGLNPIIDEEEDDFYSEESMDMVEDTKVSDTGEVDDTDVKVETPELKDPPGITFEDDNEEQENSKEEAKVSSNSDILTQEEKMRYYADKVMSALVGNKNIKDYAMKRLLACVTPKVFRDENYVLFSIIFNYKDRIRNISIDSDFVSLFLDNNREFIEKSTGYIDIHAYGEVDGSEALGYIAGVVKHFNRLCTMADMDESSFDLYFEKYIVVFKAIEAQKVYVTSNAILTEGVRIGGKNLVGFEDSFNYSRRKLAEIEGLLDMNSGTGFTSMKEILLENKEDSKKPEKIADFDKLKALNNIYGGIYTGTFYEVLAPTKGGKTKFCNRVCHTAAIKYKTNVTVWAHEGGNEAWTAQMRAIHFDYTYNEDADVTDRKFGIDQDTILYDKFPSPELKELEMASKMDLACNVEYGNIDYIDRPFEVETFIEEIDTSVKANNSKLVIIDYLQLIGSSSHKKGKPEVISKAYQMLLNYCKKNNIAVLTPAQYKQNTLDSMAATTNTANVEMRTAGGESSEVFRTPDVIFAFWASTEDLLNNRMKILSVPGRFKKTFPEIPCYIDLGVCQFISLDN